MEKFIEGTELIAEFMGAKYETKKYYLNEYYSDHSFEGLIDYEGWWLKGYPIDYENGLEYDSSWAWLMPVVEKIESLFNNGVCVTIDNKSCFIVVTNCDFSRYVASDSKIEAVYTNCVEFIKWYNEQNKL